MKEFYDNEITKLNESCKRMEETKDYLEDLLNYELIDKFPKDSFLKSASDMQKYYDRLYFAKPGLFARRYEKISYELSMKLKSLCFEQIQLYRRLEIKRKKVIEEKKKKGNYNEKINFYSIPAKKDITSKFIFKNFSKLEEKLFRSFEKEFEE